MPLGSFAGSSYDEAGFDLEPGDVYVFCTDGVFEARDPQGREFGVTRLLDVVAAHRPKSARELIDEIFAALHAFRAEAPLHDDMTAVVLKITG